MASESWKMESISHVEFEDCGTRRKIRIVLTSGTQNLGNLKLNVESPEKAGSFLADMASEFVNYMCGESNAKEKMKQALDCLPDNLFR